MKKTQFLLFAVAGVATIFGAGAAAAQDIYVSDTSDNSLTVITPGVGTTILTSSDLDDPTGLAFDGSNLFIADSGNGDITEYSTTTGKFSIFASGVGLSDPQGLAFDSEGNLYVANASSDSISQFLGGSTSAPTYASGINTPSGITVDGNGNLFVTTAGNQVEEILPNSPPTTGSVHSFYLPTPAGSNPALDAPEGIVFGPNGDLYVVNSGTTPSLGTPAVYQLTLYPKGTTAVGGVDQGLSDPAGLVFDSNGDLWVADYGNNSVTVYSPVPGSDGTYTLAGSYTSGFDGPTDLAVGPGPPVPEPGTYVLLLGGLGALYFYQRRRTAAPVKV
jgi:sugar lactone lactonase YvrE